MDERKTSLDIAIRLKECLLNGGDGGTYCECAGGGTCIYCVVFDIMEQYGIPWTESDTKLSGVYRKLMTRNLAQKTSELQEHTPDHDRPHNQR